MGLIGNLAIDNGPIGNGQWRAITQLPIRPSTIADGTITHQPITQLPIGEFAD